jgi:steroid delta-isomerase
VPGNEEVKRAVERYVATLGDDRAASIAELFAEDAVFEDPVGGDVRRGREAIRAFYESALGNQSVSSELITLRVSGGEAAFHFRLEVGGRIRIDIIDVMRFDDAGAITSMKAYWSPEDIVAL